MKQDQNNTDKNDTNLDSVPFPDQKTDGEKHCCCHGGHDTKHEGDKDGAHECKCHKDGNSDECSCKDDGDSEHGECECKAQNEALAKLDAIVAENLALRDMLVRTTADFDNYRKRTVREKEESRKVANADFVAALIPVLDSMALALDAARKHHPEAAAVLDGIDMIMNQLKGFLKAQGVEEINPVGATFDPNLHESISSQPSDSVEEGKISAVARTGYILNGRLLRPATVILSSGKAK